MFVKSFAELEEIVREDTDLEPKDYIASFVRNDKKYPIKNERHFAGFISEGPNDGGVYRIVITRADDKPKPVSEEESKEP